MLRRSIAGLVFATTFFAAPTHAQVCTPFTDVSAQDPFCGNIQWMFNRGITLGCSATQYCPAQYVRRDQMAAFMNRLGNVVFEQGGSAFGATAVLGTADDQPLDIRANNARVMRYEPNAISPNVIGGSSANNVTAGVRGATIGGGGIAGFDPDLGGSAPNRVTDVYGTVSGGYANRAGDDAGSTIDAPFATVGGGLRNMSGSFATVGGGAGNTASGVTSFVGGGNSNTASGPNSTIAGGTNNLASGSHSAVAGGHSNAASGDYSIVAGGSGNGAPGYYSFAAGYGAQANYAGCFVYADTSSYNPTSCFAQSEIVVRGLGGFYFWTAGNADSNYSGARLATGTGAWAAYSDRNGKEHIHPVDSGLVLEKLVAMPIATWQWKSEPGAIRHMGPMAQDFHSAFGLGDSNTQIVTVDADGVALAAIQGLNAKLEQRGAEIAAMKSELAELRRAIGASPIVAEREQ